MPIVDTAPQSEGNALQQLQDLSLPSLTPVLKKQWPTRLARILQHASALDSSDVMERKKLAVAIDEAALWFDSVRAVECKDYADIVDGAMGASEHLAFREVAGHVRMLSGVQLGRANRLPEAVTEYQRAVVLLSERSDAVIREYWAYATMQCVRFQLKEEFETCVQLLASLIEETKQHFNPYVRNRAIEATAAAVKFASQHCPDRAEALALPALALSRAEANPYTGTGLTQIVGDYAFAMRELKRPEEALQVCQRFQELEPMIKDFAGLDAFAWGLAEAAYIAADLLHRPQDALPFIAQMRAKFSERNEPQLRSELTFGIAMEATCHFVLGNNDRALALCEEVRTRAVQLPKEGGAQAALAETENLRAKIFLKEGKLEEARAQWQSVIQQFQNSSFDGVRAEVEKAKTSLQVNGG